MAVYILAITNHSQVCFPAKNFLSTTFGTVEGWTATFARASWRFLGFRFPCSWRMWFYLWSAFCHLPFQVVKAIPFLWASPAAPLGKTWLFFSPLWQFWSLHNSPPDHARRTLIPVVKWSLIWKPNHQTVKLSLSWLCVQCCSSFGYYSWRCFLFSTFLSCLESLQILNYRF